MQTPGEYILELLQERDELEKTISELIRQNNHMRTYIGRLEHLNQRGKELAIHQQAQIRTLRRESVLEKDKNWDNLMD
jgi:regulator of replication initiation timing